jgi:hypothetical protein
LGEPPPSLTTAEMQAWHAIVASCPDVLRSGDSGFVRLCAIHLAQWQRREIGPGSLRLLVRLFDQLLMSPTARRALLLPPTEDSTMHAAPPTICSKCAADIATLAASMNASPVVSFCSHQAPTSVTFVVAHAKDGEIRQWDCSGPMTFADAQRHAARIEALAPQQRGN